MMRRSVAVGRDLLQATCKYREALKILVANHEYPPIGAGGANACLHMVRHFRDRGHRVMVVTSSFAGLPRLCREQGAIIFRVPSIRRRMDRTNFLEVVGFTATGSLRAATGTPRFRPDATLAFFTIPGGAIGLTLKWLFGVPYIVSLRGADVPGFLNEQSIGLKLAHFVAKPAVRTIWRQSTHVVGNSQGLVDLARETSPKIPFQVIPNGVDTDRFTPRVGPRPQGPVRILFAGRFNSQKGLPLLVKALARLNRPEVPAWRLRLVGDGPMRDRVTAAAKAARIFDRTDFLGWQPPEVLAEEYREADLFVLPSFSEGMPNVVLEAMAAGQPIVATDIAGNNELSRPGENGYLIPTGQVPPLSQALEPLIRDPLLRQRMGEASRRIVLAEYGWPRVADAYLDLLAESATRRGRFGRFTRCH